MTALRSFLRRKISADRSRLDMKVELREAFDQERGVVASEAEVVAEGNVHFGFASDVWHVVEIALGIGLVEVDGRWDDAVFHRHQASGDFNATCCTKKVTSHGFR